MAAASAKDMRALGLDGDFSLGELKSAFRARAKLCHPDLGNGRGQDFAHLRESYERLLARFERRPATRPKARPKPRSGGEANGKNGGKASGKAEPRRGPARSAGRGEGAQALAAYREGLAQYESFQSVNRDRSMELAFLYSLTKKNIALVDLHRFLRLLDAMEKSAVSAIGLLSRALALDASQSWAAEAGAKAASLERQLARCRALKAEAGGDAGR